MQFSAELIDEIRVLAMFNLDSVNSGIKAHKMAEPQMLAAISRLYSKGLINQPDGGYLTDLGIHCAEQLQTALRILGTSESS
ncbi:TIGR02647 family protein [Rheinheimera sp. UJ63]|uniref:TIGR02647 family protein n=1 Tax=Rheinheimera sp. UJ63 TaxID=2910157 RepID=UPI001F1AAC65|nr:TIGR02647 family protein [Rheinheimera sp. UJ63]MCF4009674.1 TIGR02647 family protein [Rheinheimera sp. UJ63]